MAAALAVLVALLVGVAAPSAYGTPRLRLIGTAVTRLYSDGVRWAAYEPTAGTTRLIDARTGRWSRRHDPEGCAGGLIAVGSEDLLYQCSHQPCEHRSLQFGGCVVEGPGEASFDANYVVVDIATKIARAVVGDRHLPLDDSPVGGYTHLTAIGSQWVEGETSSERSGYVFFLNWHTGEVRQETERPNGNYPTFEDLDNAKLVRPICTPLRRRAAADPGVRGALPFAYAAPFAVEADEVAGELSLMRCGSHLVHALPGERAGSLQIGGGVLSWIAADPRIENNDDTMYLTRLEPHSRSWHGRIYTLTGPEVGADHMLLQHTRTTVYETATRQLPIHIYAARIP
jgi:hypothetical protein